MLKEEIYFMNVGARLDTNIYIIYTNYKVSSES